MDHEKFCNDILEIDPKVRFAAIYDKWATRVCGGMRPDVKNLLSERAEHELVNLSILDWQSRKNVSKWLGKTKYAMAEYAKIRRFSFYLGDDYLLLVSTETDYDINLTVNHVIDLYYKNQN